MPPPAEASLQFGGAISVEGDRDRFVLFGNGENCLAVDSIGALYRLYTQFSKLIDPLLPLTKIKSASNLTLVILIKQRPIFRVSFAGGQRRSRLTIGRALREQIPVPSVKRAHEFKPV